MEVMSGSVDNTVVDTLLITSKGESGLCCILLVVL